MRDKVLKVYFIALLVGGLTGLVGSVFQLAIARVSYFYHYLIQHWSTQHLPTWLISSLLTLIMTVAAWYLVKRFAPEASGSGVQEIEGVLLDKRPIYWRRLLPVKFIGGMLAIGSNLVVGREGPTIQMGGNLAAMAGEFFHLKHNRLNTLIAAGAAAGLACAFNAPLAGVLFVIEEMRNEFNFNFTNFKMVALSCVMSTIITHLILGANPAIPMSVFASPSNRSLMMFFFFGIIVGLAGWLFNVLLMHSLTTLDRLSPKQRFLYVAGVGVLIGFLSMQYPAVVGGGYEIIEQSLTLYPPSSLLMTWLIVRLLTTLLCYTSAVPGGIFAPLLALGTLLGLASYKLLIHIVPDMTTQPGMFAVAGMGALFSAAVRAPITGIILVVEMTQNYSLILPLMVSCLTSTTVVQLAKNAPIYTQLLKRTLHNQAKES